MADWTVETLREHLCSLLSALQDKNDARFDAMEKATASALAAAEKATAAALAAAQRAVEKAETATDKRLVGMNELREAMNDQASRFMPRAETEVRLTSMDEQLRTLSARIDRNEGRGAGLHAGWGYLVGGVGFIAAIIGIVIALL